MAPLVAVLFWSALLLLLFPYGIYPLLLRLAPRRPARRRHDYEPEVTIIIAAYNEEAEISNKLENTLALDYPEARRHIMVASDQSSDGTDDLVRTFAERGVELIRLAKRGGKTAAQNAAVAKAEGEILVFTDCGTYLDRLALRRLIGPLADPDFACAGAYLEFARGEHPELAARKKHMTDFDQELKVRESAADSLVGVNGALYAWRSDVAKALPPELTSDLMVPLETIRAGKRVAFAADAYATEAVAASETREFRRKVRTARAGIVVARRYAGLFFSLRRPWVALALWGHKGLRWLGLPLLVLALATNLLLMGSAPAYALILAGQALFYLLVILGWSGLLKGILRFPYYFVFLNVAASLALIQSFTRPASEVWETGSE